MPLACNVVDWCQGQPKMKGVRIHEQWLPVSGVSALSVRFHLRHQWPSKVSQYHAAKPFFQYTSYLTHRFLPEFSHGQKTGVSFSVVRAYPVGSLNKSSDMKKILDIPQCGSIYISRIWNMPFISPFSTLLWETLGKIQPLSTSRGFHFYRMPVLYPGLKKYWHITLWYCILLINIMSPIMLSPFKPLRAGVALRGFLIKSIKNLKLLAIQLAKRKIEVGFFCIESIG